MRKEDCVYESVCKQECSNSCIRYIQFHRLLELSNLPKIYQKPITIYTIDADYQAYKELDMIGKDILNFVQSGKDLYICSTTPGNAKTTWAAKLMLKYFDKTWPKSYDVTRGLFIHVPTLLLDLKRFDNIPEYIDRIKEADLVIWDDLAINKLTDYEHEQLLQFIDYRIQNELSNIYTSNIIEFDILKTFVGGRLASRIFNASKTITFVANDFRVGGKV